MQMGWQMRGRMEKIRKENFYERITFLSALFFYPVMFVIKEQGTSLIDIPFFWALLELKNHFII